MEKILQTNVFILQTTTKGVNGKTYKSDYRAILSWVVEKVRQKTPIKKNGIDDFKELWEEARKEDEQNGNITSNNAFGW